MTTLRERLTEVFMKQLKESHENSKEMIASNSTSFDEMGMAHTAPGEFAQEEITDHANLENTGSMANDTEFSGKVDSGCDNCDSVSITVGEVDDAMNSLASDIVDISVKDDEEVEPEETEEDEVDELIKKVHESVNTSLLSTFKNTLNESDDNVEDLKEWGWLARLIPAVTRVLPSLAKASKPLISKVSNNVAKVLPTLIKTSPKMIVANGVADGIDTLANTAATNTTNAVNSMTSGNLLKNNASGAIKGIGESILYVAKKLGTSLADAGKFVFELCKAHPSLAMSAAALATVVPLAIKWANKNEDMKESVIDLFESDNMLNESAGDDYAGPQDFVPDSRINASAVLNALKKEIGEGSEGIHVDQDQDDKDKKTWIVTQIDEKKLPAELDVINVTLKKDGNKYKVKEMKKDFPAMK